MSERLLKENGFRKGEKVIYIPRSTGQPITLTAKDVVTNWDDEIVVITEELEGYLSLSDVYTKERILSYFS